MYDSIGTKLKVGQGVVMIRGKRSDRKLEIALVIGLIPEHGWIATTRGISKRPSTDVIVINDLLGEIDFNGE